MISEAKRRQFAGRAIEVAMKQTSVERPARFMATILQVARRRNFLLRRPQNAFASRA
jgi:hypothetical protein